jgi:hypothetical protein
MMTSRLVQPALLAGLMVGVLSVLPIINVANCCCLWVIGGGVLAAFLLQQNELAAISYADGALAGLGAGIVGALVWLVLYVPVQLLTGPFQQRIVDRILANASDLPPDVQAALEGMQAGGLWLPLVLGFGLMMGIGLVFGSLGGLLGAALFRRTPPATEPPFVPPPLPPSSPQPPAY